MALLLIIIAPNGHISANIAMVSQFSLAIDLSSKGLPGQLRIFRHFRRESMSNQTIIALYDDKASARQVLEELRTAGYGDEFWISGDSSYGSTETGRFSSLNSDFSAPGSRTSALTRLGVPEDEAQIYSEAVRRGGVLLVGQVDDS